LAIRVYDMIEIPASIGEVFDKITILEIKQENIIDSTKLANVSKELSLLRDRVKDIRVDSLLLNQLRKVNQQLWHIEDRIRVLENNQNFGKEFIELARSVYITNDQRASLKKQINLMAGSELIEEKSYS